MESVDIVYLGRPLGALGAFVLNVYMSGFGIFIITLHSIVSINVDCTLSTNINE